ncbi:MAG: SusC/RagA family TonB-linked outer membrane protein [Dysgonamonadaceae bacterium]|nr:SusC/RagA family TonB-linked outer membrane protein [Dysgonamonadaceae bacterium]
MKCFFAAITLLLLSPVFLSPTLAQDSGRRLISGHVFDSEGEALTGVSVTLKSKPTVGTVTDLDGKFIVEVTQTSETLVFSYVGMKKKEVAVKTAQADLKVVMENDATQLSEVVVEAGIIQHNRMGFTGSYRQVDREELRSVGNINVLKTLGSLDPSFAIADNNLMGSDPNTMANISLRGGSTMNITNVLNDQTANPNEPLFILDGFETTLQTVNDLDINRIESITILKDAGSTAIYGSKGGNGVVVIETIKPKQGQLMINYNGDYRAGWADLSDYNLMNAAEKLEFEVKAGRFGDINDWNGNLNNIVNYYMPRYEQVARGVDTYWLKTPIRSAFTQGHSMDVSGGNESFLYQIGVNYKDVEGVMKDSYRQSFGGNSRLTYRRKNFSVSNNLSISVTNGHDGSWGSFSDFSRANPYFEMRNPDGTIPEYLDSYDSNTNQYRLYGTADNPLYNALLSSRKDSRNQTLTDNLNLIWNITEKLRWQASASITSTNSTSENFTDPKNTMYRDVDYTEKGQYSHNSGNSWRYNVNTSLNYAHTFNSAHNLTFTGRTSAQSSQNDNTGYVATGFPVGVDGKPSYANQYKLNSRPSYSQSVSRQVSFVTAVNYNYKYRYLLDFSYNADGTTAFGRNRKFQNFWSAGTGWNVHKEPFAQNWEWMQELKLRGSYGINGNQNVSNYSTNVYSYFPGSDIFGTGSYLDGYANPNLAWQTAKKTSAGIDLLFLDGKLLATYDIYQTYTDPMVVSINQKPSSGITSYPVNMGFLKNRGMEFTLAYYMLKNTAKQTSLSIRWTGRIGKSQYGGFQNALNNLNEQFKTENGASNAALNPNSLVKYQDGESPTALWAVRSLGIDPATGSEVFLTKEGVPTTVYNIDDRVKVADSNPDITGIVGLSLRWKKLIANFNLRYSIGGFRFNSALFDKVENITMSQLLYNQDRRALYDRWQEPGDVSQFNNIGNLYSTTARISSRFIQRDNYLSGESGKISWDFSKDKWLKSVGMQDLRIGVSMSDLFRISTIRQERGIDYPFERSISMQLSATFSGGGIPMSAPSVASNNAINENVNRYREELAQTTAELEKVKKELALSKQQQPKEVTVKEIQEEVVLAGQTAVFFEIGSAVLDDRGRANIKLIAKTLKKNSSKQFKVTGYADAATGTPQFNKELSNARAKAVYEALIAEGVNKDTILYAGVGDTENVFDKDHLNRAVIMEHINK